MKYLGDFAEDQTVNFKWNTNDASGASITRATDGTVYVYKDDATGTEVTTGVTDTEDHDSLTGVHHCKIVTTDAFYATGAEYFVVLKAATIDGQTVNACLAQFSIENRFVVGTDSAATEAKQDIIDTNIDTLLTRITALIATKSEMDTAHALLATPTQVNAQCDTALSDYDGPTKTEMDIAHALLATPAQVNTQCDSALSDYNGPTSPEMVSAFTEIKGVTWSGATDTLEHIRNKETDIEADTQDIQAQIGTAGAGLTDLGGMSTGMKAEVEAECDDSIDGKFNLSAGIVESNLKQIDGQATNGNNATLNLKKLNIVNNTGDAVVASSTGSNGHGIEASGNGTGSGIIATGGATGHGLQGKGGSSSGHGIFGYGGGGGAGLRALATGNNSGLDVGGSGNGHGIKAAASQSSGTGRGIYAYGGSTSGQGIYVTAIGSGDGIAATGSGTGDGLKVTGGVTNGKGLNCVGGGAASDIHADNLEGVDAKIGTPVALDSGAATLGGMLTKMADDSAGAVFDATDDSLNAIRDRGDAAWITGGGGGGANQVDLTIEEADTTPIPDVKISIMNSDSTVLIAAGTSDINGEDSFALDDGSYKVLLSRLGWTFTVPEDLVVDETPETATYNGTGVVVGSPPSADNCRLYEYCVDQDGTALASITSYVAITDKPFDDGSGMYEIQKIVGTYNPSTGLVYWDIVKGSSILAEIDEVGLHKKYTVPDQVNARLGDLTPE